MSSNSNNNDERQRRISDSSSESGQGGSPGFGRLVGLTLWPSFIAAGVAGALFFVVVDPDLLRDAGPRLFAGLDREKGYALGFFFFWMIAAFSNALSLFLCYYGRSRQARGGRQS